MLKAIGAFCYAGGFTLGMRKHFDVHCHLEDPKPYAARTALRNLEDLDILAETHFMDHPWGGHELSYKHLVRDGWWRDDLDLIYGNPPCAAWSQAGRRFDNWKNDPRVDCTRKHFQLLKLHRPRAWVWETINSTWRKGREFVDSVAHEAMAEGYHVTALLHNVKWISCPQDRARLFLCASRHAPFIPERPDVESRKAALDAPTLLRGLNTKGNPYEGPETKHLVVWERASPGDKLANVYDKHFLPEHLKDEHGRKILGIEPQKGRPGFLLRRMFDKGPSPTVIAPMFHWDEPRILTDVETAALCGYPTSWQWSTDGKTTNGVISEIARGVCPSTADWLGEQLAIHLNSNPSTEAPTYRVVDFLQEKSGHELLA